MLAYPRIDSQLKCTLERIFVKSYERKRSANMQCLSNFIAASYCVCGAIPIFHHRFFLFISEWILF